MPLPIGVRLGSALFDSVAADRTSRMSCAPADRRQPVVGESGQLGLGMRRDCGCRPEPAVAERRERVAAGIGAAGVGRGRQPDWAAPAEPPRTGWASRSMASRRALIDAMPP